jgi:hypothetical protein
MSPPLAGARSYEFSSHDIHEIAFAFISGHSVRPENKKARRLASGAP